MSEAMGAGELRAKQKTVVYGVALGFVAIAVVGGGAWAFVPPMPELPAGDRLAFALRCAAFPALMLLFGIGAVANERFSSESIDPLAGADRGRILVHGRYLENTLQQLMLYVLATLGLAARGGALEMRAIPAIAACFVVGRVVFWVGYLRDPMLRGPGFTMTLHPVMWPLLYLAVRAAMDAVRR